MLFIWDPQKAQANIKKHGVPFEIAQTVFDDPFHLSVPNSKSQYEERWVTIGYSIDHKTLVVVHTYQIRERNEEIIRIISARKATKKEKMQYEERI